jgi:hypothetical protein
MNKSTINSKYSTNKLYWTTMKLYSFLKNITEIYSKPLIKFMKDTDKALRFLSLMPLE